MDDEHSPRARHFFEVTWTPDVTAKTVRLTAAESDVLARIACGASNARIAADRGVSVRTVANQVAHLFKKLGASSRYELMRLVVVRRDHDVDVELGELTGEEREVVRRIAMAMPLKLIAYDLNVAVGTVAGRLRRAMRKLRASSRIELLQRLGLHERT